MGSRRKRSKKNKGRGLHVIPATGSSIGGKTVIPRFNARSMSRMRLMMWDSNIYVFSPTSAAGGVTAAYGFQISNLADSSLFSKFEAYRILRVDVVAKPASQVGISGATTAALAYWSAYDPDDNTTATIVGIAAKQTARVHGLWESWEESLVPVPSAAMYAAGAFSGYSLPESETWIDSDNLNVLHYGFKLAAPQVVAAAVTTIQLLFRYHVEVIMSE
jgi:hypothetical protein